MLQMGLNSKEVPKPLPQPELSSARCKKGCEYLFNSIYDVEVLNP